MASTNVRTRRLSASSVSSVGSDNADTTSNPKAQLVEGRLRGVLGDIGNRITKFDGPQGGPVKAAGKMKSVKAPGGALKATENFVAPFARPPKAVASRQDIIKKLTRSVSTNVSGQGSSKTQVGFGIKKDAGPKVLSSFQSRAHSSKELAVKPKTVVPKEKKQEKENTSQQQPKAEESKPLELEVKTSTKPDELQPPAELENPIDNLDEAAQPKTDIECTDVVKISLDDEAVFSCQRFDILDIDAVDDKNPLLLKEYIQDICDYLFSLEKKYPVKIRYLEGRLVNSRMRAVLIDWLVEVHYQFGFMPETLYLAAKTLDRYLQKERKITRKQLQLVGVTAMYIAAKYEEVCTPTVLDFSAVSDNAFTAVEVLHMEREILTTLGYDLASPPAVFFLRRFSKAAGVSNGMAPMMIHTMAKYIMELTLVDYNTCHLFPSEQAAASLALSMLVMEKNKSLREQWTPTLEHYTTFKLDALKRILSPVVSLLLKTHEEPPKLKAVISKYSRNRLNKVTLIPELKVEEWKDRVLREFC